MKTKKIVSAFCAVSMLLSLCSFASATEAEPLSEYAGQTIAVQAIEETESGLASRVVEVTIPEGATEMEARTLIHATAFGWDLVSAHSDNFAVTDLGSKRNFTLVRNEEVQIISRTLANALNEIYVTYNITGYVSGFSIQTEVRNSSANDSSGWLNASVVDTIDGTVIREVIFRLSDIRMNANDQIKVFGRSDRAVDIGNCNVTGYYRY